MCARCVLSFRANATKPNWWRSSETPWKTGRKSFGAGVQADGNQSISGVCVCVHRSLLCGQKQPHPGSGPGKGSECECPQDVHPVGGCVHRYPSSLGLLVRVAVAAGAAKLQRDYVGQDLRCSDPAFFPPYSPPVKLRLTSTVHTATPLSSSSSLLMCNNGATQQQGKHSANFRKFHWKNNRP